MSGSIPAWAYRAALEVDLWFADGHRGLYVESIARAIMAERERCANIARPLPLNDGSDYEKQAHDIRAVIEQAIRGDHQ